jgi:ABC-type glycerol-3-phosphate transport system permease component
MRKITTLDRKTPGEKILHILVSLIFAAVAFTYVYLFFWAVMSACKTHTEIVMNPFALPKKWHWDHFAEVITSLEVNGHGFWEMLFNSCFFSVFGALLQTFVTITFAYCCTMYKFPGSNLPYTIILVIMTLPIYGAGGATYALYRQLGMVDSYTHIICSAAGMTGSFLYFRAFFKNMSWTYAEAAAIDGCGPFRLYFKVMLPQAKPIFGALFLTTWLASWNNYESALLYLPNVPTLPVGIYQFNTEMIYRARLDILFAACVLVSIPALILFTVFNKVITTNVSVGGIKG